MFLGTLSLLPHTAGPSKGKEPVYPPFQFSTSNTQCSRQHATRQIHVHLG
jgi:hypothetical protein